MGGTDKNLDLREDNIGLRAIATITDAEVIQEAKEGKLRGWSFAFHEIRASEEDTAKGMKRRFVEELDLLEVSLIDQKKVPCYAGTSVEMRADGEEESVDTRELETEAIVSEVKKDIDYSKYKEKIQNLGGKI